MDYAFNDKTFIAVKLEPDIISISKSTILNLFNGNLDITATKGTLPNGNIDITAIKSILPSGNLDAATTKATLPDKTITIGILDTTIPTATPTKGTIPNKTLPCNTLTNGIAGTIHTTTGTFLNDSLANGILVTTRNTPKSSHTVKLAISVAAAFAFVFTAAGLISFITYWSRSRVFKQYRTAVADPRVRNDPKYAHLLAPPIRRRMDIDPSTFSAAPRSRIPAHVRLKHYPHKQGSSRPSAARRALMEDSSTEGSVGSDGLQSPHGAGL